MIGAMRYEELAWDEQEDLAKSVELLDRSGWSGAGSWLELFKSGADLSPALSATMARDCHVELQWWHLDDWALDHLEKEIPTEYLMLTIFDRRE